MRLKILQKVEGGDHKIDYEVTRPLPLCLLDTIELSKDIEKLVKKIRPFDKNLSYHIPCIRTTTYNYSTGKRVRRQSQSRIG